MPPASRVSSCLEPVVMEISSERRWCISVAVVKPMGTSLEAGVGRSEWCFAQGGWRIGRIGLPSARILVAFCSEMPFICSRRRRGLSVVSTSKVTVKSAGEMMNERVSNRFHRIITTFNDQSNIPFRKTSNTLGGNISTLYII